MYSERFGKQLKDYRYDKRMTQREVAEKLNVATATYANWEQGRTQPSLDDLHKLIFVLDIDTRELFESKS